VQGARALVVDDWDLAAQQVQDALALEGVLGGRAASEAEAMALTAAIPFDLIVLSLSMTNEDALRLASRLRAADATHDIPLLLIAEPEQRDRILRGFDLGANDWLMRPLDENELRVRARNQIRRKFYQDRLRADLGHALEMALTDPLTGFYNQRYLMRHLRGLMTAGLSGGICVLMLDVDHFKQVNDRYGHAAGDRALKLVAETLRSRTRVFDSIARYGGEEFVVVMPGSSASDGLHAAERLRAAIEATPFHPTPGTTHRLTVSIGVEFTAARDTTPEQLLQDADAAMYRAKRGGRNRVELAGATQPAEE
jgi:two-component system cell cycle response regulator